MNDLTKKYNLLNNTFKRKLIYHVGIDAGFFAEYTYMLNAMLYCLKHKICFVLYSNDANFGANNGWSDYFETFCDETNDSFHRKFNKHRTPSWSKIIKTRSIKMIKWKVKSHFLNFIGDTFAIITYKQKTYLNHHITFNFNDCYYIPELEINGNYLHAFKVMINITWRIKPEVRIDSIKLSNDLQLPVSYIGCQIRGGDKITETELLSIDCYVDYFKKHFNLNDVFVLTDDYRIFNDLKSKFPDYKWHTLCSSEEVGYINKDFSLKKGKTKYQQMLRFLTSVELLMHSSYFVGSITAGPSLFLLKWFYPNHYPIDCNSKHFSEFACLPIAERGKISKKYMNLK